MLPKLIFGFVITLAAIFVFLLGLTILVGLLAPFFNTVPVSYNFRSIRARWTSTIVAVLGIAGTVGVFVAMLSLAKGFRATLVASGSPGNALVVVEVLERVVGDAQLLENVLLHFQHRMIKGVDRIEFLIRKLTRIRDAVHMDIEESHEDPDDQAGGVELAIAQCIAHGIIFAFDAQNGLVGPDTALVEDNAVSR